MHAAWSGSQTASDWYPGFSPVWALTRLPGDPADVMAVSIALERRPAVAGALTVRERRVPREHRLPGTLADQRSRVHRICEARQVVHGGTDIAGAGHLAERPRRHRLAVPVATRGRESRCALGHADCRAYAGLAGFKQMNLFRPDSRAGRAYRTIQGEWLRHENRLGRDGPIRCGAERCPVRWCGNHRSTGRPTSGLRRRWSHAARCRGHQRW
jgi:hypothetical protein